MPIVQETIELPGSQTPTGFTVQVKLVANVERDGVGFTSGGAAIQGVWQPTVTAGVWSVELIGNEDIDPAETVYKITTRGPKGYGPVVRHVSVPASGGPYEVSDILSDVPDDLSPGYTLSTSFNSLLTDVAAIVTDWHSAVPTTHSWDWNDAVRYDAEGLWDEAGECISSIPDGGSATSLNKRAFRRDDGEWAATVKTTEPGDLPGQVWIPASSKFGGRACGYSRPTGILGDTLWSAIDLCHCLVTGGPTGTDYFNAGAGYAQPYWLAILARLPASSVHSNQTLIDSVSGGITLGEDDTSPTKWGVTTDFGDPWPAHSHDISDEETVLVFLKVDGANSFLEINWKDADGVIQTDRDSIVLDDQVGEPLKQNNMIFSGMSHANYMSAMKFDLGTPTEAELDILRAWAEPYMPPKGPTPTLESPAAEGVSIRSSGLAVVNGTELQTAIEELDAGMMPKAGGDFTGDIRLLNGVDIIQRIASTDRFQLVAQTVLGAHFSQVFDIVNNRAILSVQAGAAAAAVTSMKDSANVVRGTSGQTSELLGLYTELAAKRWSVEPDFTVLLADLTGVSAPSSGTKLWGASDGLKTRRNGGSELTLATTADITTAINNLINSAPGALDTLDELAAALGDDASFATTVTNALAAKAALAGASFTGDLKMEDTGQLVLRMGSTDTFELRTLAFGANFAQFFDLVNNRAIWSAKAGAAGATQFAIADSFTVTRGATGQTTNLIEAYDSDAATLLFALPGATATKGSVDIRDLAEPAAPAANYTRLSSSTTSPTGLRSRRNGGASFDFASTTHTLRTVSGTTDTLVITDGWKRIRCTNASATVVTVPTNTNVAFPVGTWLEVWCEGAGGVAVTGDTGVTVNGSSGGSQAVAQRKLATLYKAATNTWDVSVSA
jgi:hypothetical protein